MAIATNKDAVIFIISMIYVDLERGSCDRLLNVRSSEGLLRVELCAEEGMWSID